MMSSPKSLISKAASSPAPKPTPANPQDLIHPFCRLYYQCESLDAFDRQLLYLKYCFFAEEEKKSESSASEADTQLLPLLGDLREISEPDLQKYLEPCKQYAVLARNLSLLLEGEGFEKITEQTKVINEKLTQFQTELNAVKEFYSQYKSGLSYNQLFEKNQQLAILLLLTDELIKSPYTSATLSSQLNAANLKELEGKLKSISEKYDSLIKFFSTTNIKGQPLIIKIRLDSAQLIVGLIKKARISITLQKTLAATKATTTQVIDTMNNLNLKPQSLSLGTSAPPAADSKKMAEPKNASHKVAGFIKNTSSSAGKKSSGKSSKPLKPF